jgi:hypothetical protein
VRFPPEPDVLFAQVGHPDAARRHEGTIHDIDLHKRGKLVGESDEAGEFDGVIGEDCRHNLD